MTDTCLSVLRRWGTEIKEEDLYAPVSKYFKDPPNVPCLHGSQGDLSFHQTFKDKDFSKATPDPMDSSILGRKLCLSLHILNETQDPNITMENPELAEVFALVVIASILKEIEKVVDSHIRHALKPQETFYAAPFTEVSNSSVMPSILFETAEKYGLDLLQALNVYTEKAWRACEEKIPEALTKEYNLVLPYPGCQNALMGFSDLALSQRTLLSKVYPYFSGFYEYNGIIGPTEIYEDIFLMPLEVIRDPSIRARVAQTSSIFHTQPCWEREKPSVWPEEQNRPCLEHIYNTPEVTPEFSETLKTLAKTNAFSLAIDLAKALVDSK